MAIGRPDAVAPSHTHAARPGRATGAALLALALASALIGLLFAAPHLFAPAGTRQPPLPGLTLEDLGPPRGVVVTSIQSDSPAVVAGIAVGDRIVGLDRSRVASLADIRRFAGPHHPMAVDMRLARGNKPVELTYVFPSEADR